MRQWSRASMVLVVAIAAATLATVASGRRLTPGHSGSTKDSIAAPGPDQPPVATATPSARATSSAAVPPSAAAVTPSGAVAATQPDPQARVPVATRYDDGGFVDADPDPGPYELRSWAMLRRGTDTIIGSRNSASARNSAESMIKAWIASDYLRRLGDEAPSSTRLRQIRGMIRDSDDQDAEAVYVADGRDAVVERMINICGLKNTTVWPYWWSRTEISAQDAVRMGNCIATGKAAGPKWTRYILNEMRAVRGEGRFGIVDALPQDEQKSLAIKNGWTAISWDHDQWHVNCLGITDDWVLVVQAKYPIQLGLKYGAGFCQAQAAKVLSANS